MNDFGKYLHWTDDGRATCDMCHATASSFTVLIHAEACEVGIEQDREEARQRIEWEQSVAAREARAARRKQFYQELKAQEANDK